MTALDRRPAARVIEAALARPFVWGESDGLRLALDVYCAVTGKPDPAAGIAWRSALGAARCLKNRGFADIAEALDTILPAPIAPGQALLGDIGVVGRPRATCAVVHAGHGWVGADPDGGLVRVPLGQVTRAWRLG